MAIVNDKSLNQTVHDAYHPTGVGDETAQRSIIVDGATGEYITGDDGSIATIQYEHMKVHEGKIFTVSDCDDEVDIGVPKYWLMISPSGNTFCHLTIKAVSSKNGTIEGFILPTVTDNGTALYASNNNINYVSSVPEVQFFADPTVTDEGTLRYSTVMGSDGNNPVGAAGGSDDRGLERIVGLGVPFLFKFTALSNDCRVCIEFTFYEEEEE